MSDTKQVLDVMMPRIHKAETTLHNGDAGPRFEMWSHTDPISTADISTPVEAPARSVPSIPRRIRV
jgi:hypothetical protein